MKVKVLQPFQVSYAGKVHRPGETAEVPDPLGHEWLRSAWVEPVDAGAKKAQAALDAEETARVARLAVDKDASGPADEHGRIVHAGAADG